MTYQETLATLREASDALLDSLDVTLTAGSEACEMLDEFQKEVLQMLEELGDSNLVDVPAKLKTLQEFVAGYNDGASLQKEIAAQAKDGHAVHEFLKARVDELREYDDDGQSTATTAASGDDDDDDDDKGGRAADRPPHSGARAAPGRLLKWPWRMFS